jgi:hypothetical protein
LIIHREKSGNITFKGLASSLCAFLMTMTSWKLIPRRSKRRPQRPHADIAFFTVVGCGRFEKGYVPVVYPRRFTVLLDGETIICKTGLALFIRLLAYATFGHQIIRF